MGSISQCPVCHGVTKPYDDQIGINADISCENCGEYIASYEVVVDRRVGNMSAVDRAHFSGWIRDRSRRGEEVIITSYDIDPVLKNVPRLSPAQKSQHFLLTLARISARPGVTVQGQQLCLSDAWAQDVEELKIYATWLLENGYINAQLFNAGRFLLTLSGWTEVDRLQAERAKPGNWAFMAMPFGDSRLDGIVTDHFVPAVKAAGFELRRLDEGQPAGLIDDQLRVRLRTAVIVVADLTNGNRGAYWEAGFAEGLGTPVVYTCEKAVFDGLEAGRRTHFDTNHLVTVLWEDGKLEEAANRLKAIVRATLPHLAKLED